MRYLPKSPADREAMLAEIGVASIESLFETIPAEYRLTEDLKIPRQHSESEILERFRAFGANVASGDAMEMRSMSTAESSTGLFAMGAVKRAFPCAAVRPDWQAP